MLKTRIIFFVLLSFLLFFYLGVSVSYAQYVPLCDGTQTICGPNYACGGASGICCTTWTYPNCAVEFQCSECLPAPTTTEAPPQPTSPPAPPTQPPTVPTAPPPPPPPIYSCGTPCTQPTECQGAQGGCNYCVSNVCQAPPPPQGPLCNSACIRNEDCIGATDGILSCSLCISGVCQTPPPGGACNNACVKDLDCQADGALDGCTQCLSGVCKNPVACGSLCSSSLDCVGALNGCNSCISGICQNPVSCNSPCAKDADCQSSGAALSGCSSCIGGVCKPPSGPVCNSACLRDSDCLGATDGTRSCSSCISGTCQPPKTNTCNSVCTKNADCAGAKDGCTNCIAATCQKPTPSCNSACNKNTDCAGAKDGCTNCILGTCSAFSSSMCSCDGMDASQIISGQEAEFTAFGKVEGANTQKAQIQDFSFFIAKDSTIIGQSGPIKPTNTQSSSSLVNYQAKWKFTIPQDDNSNSTYRVWNQINCKPKSATISASFVAKQPLAEKNNQKQVLGTTGQKNFLEALWSAILSLVGTNTQPVTSQNTVDLSPTPQLTPGQQTLHFSTFTPAKIVDKTCTFILFRL